VAPLAVFAHLQAVWIILLVFHGGVVAPLTHTAGEGDYVFHSCLFGWAEKKKA
jgi:hypothetical protein